MKLRGININLAENGFLLSVTTEEGENGFTTKMEVYESSSDLLERTYQLINNHVEREIEE